MGHVAGAAAFALLLMLPPFKAFMTDFVIEYGRPGPGMTVDRSVVGLAMALGFMGVVLFQTIGMLVISLIWWKSRR